MPQSSDGPSADGAAFDWGMKRLNRAMKRHGDRCDTYAKREAAWLAVKENDADNQRARVRFAYQRMDTLMAYITAEKPVGRVKPMNPGPKCESAAKLMEKGQNEWRRKDHRDEKMTELALTSCIFGNAPAKSVWAYERATEIQRVVKRSLLGGPGKLVEQEVEVTLMDQPSLAPVDPYDFAWDPSCTSLDDADFVVLFSYPTLAQLKQGEKEGRYHNLDKVTVVGDRGSAEFQRPGRERDLAHRIEVAEVWDRGRLVVIANRRVCIRDEASMWQHHQLPFVICSTMPNQWTLEGTSEVEIVAAIQQEMHEFRHAYMFNAKLASKLLILLEGDARDVAKVNTALLDDNTPVSVLPMDNAGVPPTTWSPAAPLIQMGQNIMEGLKKEMDDISGIGPYISGTTEGSVDPKTATEIQALQSGAMRRITAKRNQLNKGYARAGNFDLKNTKQFMTRPLAIRVDKGDGWDWEYVSPQDVVDAELEYVVEDADETLDQQEKRSQAMTRLQTALAAAQVMALLGQDRPNLVKEYEDYLTANGVLDPSEYIMAAPPPQPPPVAPPSPPPGGSGGPGGAAAGTVTPPPSGPGTGGNPPAPIGPPGPLGGQGAY